jgi:hypothetical protein
MAAATSAISTDERPASGIVYPVAEATILIQGALWALDTSGNLVNASDAANLRVIGRGEETVDNSAGSAGDLAATVKRGCFLYANSTTAAVDADDKGKLCFVEDNQTVAETSTHNCKAGLVVDVTTDGVWVDTTYAHLATVAVTDGTTNGTFTGAADLAAVKAEAELLADFTRSIAAALRLHGIIK